MKLKELISSLSGYWLYRKKYLPLGIDLFHDLKQFFKEEALDVVFDVGANEGQSVRLFQSKIVVNRTYSFEPVPSTFRVLEKNVGDFPSVSLENLGLGSNNKSFEIAINKYSALNSLKISEGSNLTGEKEVIKITTLDDYIVEHEIDHITFLKIDTEGFEMEVLNGALATIREGKIKYIYCEVGFDEKNRRHTNWEEIHQFLLAHQYRFVAMYDMSYKVFKDHSGNLLYVLDQKS